MKNVIKNYMILAFLYLNSLLNKVKAALGLLTVKHGIMGYFEHKGTAFSSFMNQKDRVAACETFDDFRPDDVILMTYPKAGTHFTGEIMAAVLKEGKGVGTGNMTKCSLEMAPPAVFQFKLKSESGGIFADLEPHKSPRIILTHLPWNMLPKKAREGHVKVVHCMRNPKDLVCSCYPFMRTMKLLDSSLTWKQYVPNFMDGNTVYGSYTEFLRQWYPHRNNSNVLNLFFEDMKKDLEGSVKSIANFLDVELTQEQVDKIVVANTFENKKKAAGKGHVIYRKGASGGWRSDITVEQNAMLDEWIEAEMKDMPELKFQCM